MTRKILIDLPLKKIALFKGCVYQVDNNVCKLNDVSLFLTLGDLGVVSGSRNSRSFEFLLSSNGHSAELQRCAHISGLCNIHSSLYIFHKA